MNREARYDDVDSRFDLLARRISSMEMEERSHIARKIPSGLLKRFVGVSNSAIRPASNEWCVSG
jgi:hypothetical protein